MRLVDLHPAWIGAGGPGIFNEDGTPSTPRHGVGLMFDCPNGCLNDVEDHGVQRHFVAFVNPLDGGLPFEEHRPMWTREGDTFDTLRLIPSILSDSAKGGCGWHGYIGNAVPGEVTTV